MLHINKRLICIIGSVILVILSILYFIFYNISLKEFHLAIGQGSWVSPNGYFMITMNLYPEGDVDYLDTDKIQAFIEQNKEDVYVIGYLSWAPSVSEDETIIWSDKNQKIIFYDKYNGSQCYVNWLDDTTATINGVTLKLPNQSYDFRRTIGDGSGMLPPSTR